MNRSLIVALCVACCGWTEIANGDLLTIGSPVPDFAPTQFLRGSEIDVLKPGECYVIEFSGTTCGPCIKAIPLIEDLIQKFDAFTFITVFSEPETDVRAFLERAGAAMTSHIAHDDGTITRDWLGDAAVAGIPWLFVVDKNNRIAWMGHPDDLSQALSAIALNGSIGKEEIVGIALQQHAAKKSQDDATRRSEAQAHFSKVIVKLINEGRHAEAVDELERSSIEFGEFPDVVRQFQRMKFFQMSRVAGTRDAAYRLALDLAISAAPAGDSSIAATLIQHYETALPENKNLDVVYLAINILKEAPTSTNDEDETLTRRRSYFSALSRANKLLGREEAARGALQSAIAEAEKLFKLRKQNSDYELNIAGSENVLNQLKDELAKYDESKQP